MPQNIGVIINSSVVFRDPHVKGGQPVIKGTRVPVYTVLNHLALGWSIGQISEQFPTVQKRKVAQLIKDISSEYEVE